MFQNGALFFAKYYHKCSLDDDFYSTFVHGIMASMGEYIYSFMSMELLIHALNSTRFIKRLPLNEAPVYKAGILILFAQYQDNHQLFVCYVFGFSVNCTLLKGIAGNSGERC